MALYEITGECLQAVKSSTFEEKKIREREDLQRLLKANIAVLDPELMVIAEEFGDWDQSYRRIDLLALDKKANLVVIELKRTKDGGHMDLQALRYAAMVSTMTFEQACRTCDQYLKANDDDTDAEEAILEHLSWDEGDDELFAKEVRIVLASADFSKEITTTVMWLNERSMDITCFRLTPHDLDGRTILDVQQIIPLPEAEDFQVKVREKAQASRSDRAQRRKWDLERLLATIKSNTDDDSARIAQEIHDWAAPLFGRIWWSNAKIDGSFVPAYDTADKNHWFFSIRSIGKVELYLCDMSRCPPFDDDELRGEFISRLNELGADIPPEREKKYPKFPLGLLAEPDAFAEFKSIIEWAMGKVKSVVSADNA